MSDASSLMLPNQVAVASDCLYNLKPSSCRARSYRASVPSSNKSVFTAADQIIAYIPGGRKNTYLDPQQSYMRITVQNNEAAGVYFNFDGNGASIINRLDTFHSGNCIDSIQQYNALMNYILDAQLNLSEKTGLSNIYGTNSDGTVANNRAGLRAHGQQRITICIPLLGAFGLGAEKLIPIGQLYDDIRLEISTASVVEGMVWSVATVTANPYQIIDFQLELQIIELSDEGQSMVESVTPFYNPVYMHCNSWRHYSSTLNAAFSGTYSALVPARFASLKSLVVLPRRNTEIVSQLAYSTGSRINPCIASYWFRVGAYMVPQRPITLFSTSNTGGNGEAFCELQKCFHGMNRPEMCTGLPYHHYNVVDIAAIDAGIGGFVGGAGQPVLPGLAGSHANGFAIGQDFETFANKTDLLLSGMNTLTSQIFFEANVGWGAAGLTPTVAFTLDYYANFDQILVLENGIMSARF
jgi:hypothetical protein